MLPALVNSIWWAKSRPGARRFERAIRRPQETQARVLARLLKRNESSQFGQQHDFGGIDSVNRFRASVPIQPYEAFSPYIDRIRHGERAVLTVETPSALLPTSGSTSCFKLIPFTRSFRQEMDRAIAPWICGIFASRPGISAGRAYWSVSPSIEIDIESAIPIGFDSDTSYLAGPLARLVETALAVPASVTQTDDIESFRYITLLHLLRAADLTLISVWHPTYLTLLLDALPAWFDRLIKDIRTGQFAPPGGPVRRFRPDRRRADALATAGPEPTRVWPMLGLVSTWTDGESKRYTAALRARLQPIPFEAKGLVATEGIFSIPWRSQHPLAIRSHFMEFINEGNEIVELEHLRNGETYSLVITTGSGLYRYRIGDLIRVTGRVAETPCIEFVGRESGLSDLCGEKLHPSFVSDVIEELLTGFKLTTSFSLLAPRRSVPETYSLYVETEQNLPSGMAVQLDRLLSRNPHYRLCRQLGQLGEPTVQRTGRNALRRYLDESRHDHQRVGDQKPSVLSTDPKWEHILVP